MPSLRECRLIVQAVAMGITLTSPAFFFGVPQSARDAADAEKLIEVLEIHAGSTVADVGAGGGALVTPLARRIGPSGRLYATDINKDRLTDIRKLAESAGLQNVTAIEGAAAQTNLPASCCDAIYMRHVYHHFGDPAAMNVSLLRSLKPGGRLAVLDFVPNSKTSAPAGKRGDGESHGVMPATVIAELAAAGFVDVRELSWPQTSVVVIGRRPGK
jgi:ubiquinone/menaquinone biosynthesis C-methylase UbiE